MLPFSLGWGVRQRTFKTAWFAKAARKSHISDDELCDAIAQVQNGQAEDLGGGVFKKRLNRNMHRSIIVAKGRRHWIYVYLFAKQDRANIGADELVAFRKVANIHAMKSDAEIDLDIKNKEMMEICIGN